ncbi:MAG: TlpA family protein disulfide reductase [Aureispira sp.]
MRGLFLGLLLLSVSWLWAQPHNVLITGAVRNDSTGIIVLEINKRYINNTVEEISAQVNPQEHFGLTCRIEVPQLVTLRYGKKSCELFLEPNDTLHIALDGQLFPEQVRFGQHGQHNNYFWQRYRQKFPADPNIFNYRQYRKGVYYYSIHNDLDKQMQASSPIEFIDWTEEQWRQKKALLQLFTADPTQPLSSAFQTFIQTEFDYQKWRLQLTYGDVYGPRHRLEPSFLDFTDSVLVLDDGALGNSHYRAFVQAVLHYRCRQLPAENQSVYEQLYHYSKIYLSGRTKYFMMAHFIATALRKEDPKFILPLYEDFIEENPYYELDRLVLDPFQKASKMTAGMPAPNFTLFDLEGTPVSLSQFKGKVIYLDFWATWCRPCIEKIERLQHFEPKFKNKDVVFMHVSLDRTTAQWRATIQEKQLQGRHLFFDPRQSTITKDYDIVSVPKFFLITKEGNFAYTPSSYDSNELELALLKLLQEN